MDAKFISKSLFNASLLVVLWIIRVQPYFVVPQLLIKFDLLHKVLHKLLQISFNWSLSSASIHQKSLSLLNTAVCLFLQLVVVEVCFLSMAHFLWLDFLFGSEFHSVTLLFIFEVMWSSANKFARFGWRFITLFQFYLNILFSETVRLCITVFPAFLFIQTIICVSILKTILLTTFQIHIFVLENIALCLFMRRFEFLFSFMMSLLSFNFICTFSYFSEFRYFSLRQIVFFRIVMLLKSRRRFGVGIIERFEIDIHSFFFLFELFNFLLESIDFIIQFLATFLKLIVMSLFGLSRHVSMLDTWWPNKTASANSLCHINGFVLCSRSLYCLGRLIDWPWIWFVSNFRCKLVLSLFLKGGFLFRITSLKWNRRLFVSLNGSFWILKSLLNS